MPGNTERGPQFEPEPEVPKKEEKEEAFEKPEIPEKIEGLKREIKLLKEKNEVLEKRIANATRYIEGISSGLERIKKYQEEKEEEFEE